MIESGVDNRRGGDDGKRRARRSYFGALKSPLKRTPLGLNKEAKKATVHNTWYDEPSTSK